MSKVLLSVSVIRGPEVPEGRLHKSSSRHLIHLSSRGTDVDRRAYHVEAGAVSRKERAHHRLRRLKPGERKDKQPEWIGELVTQVPERSANGRSRRSVTGLAKPGQPPFQAADWCRTRISFNFPAGDTLSIPSWDDTRNNLFNNQLDLSFDISIVDEPLLGKYQPCEGCPPRALIELATVESTSLVEGMRISTNTSIGKSQDAESKCS